MYIQLFGFPFHCCYKNAVSGDGLCVCKNACQQYFRARDRAGCREVVRGHPGPASRPPRVYYFQTPSAALGRPTPCRPEHGCVGAIFPMGSRALWGMWPLVPPCGEVFSDPFPFILKAHRMAFYSNLKCVIGLNVPGTSQLISTLYVSIRCAFKTLKIN